MAHRHLMAVCVVCLLCAEHMPCKDHVMVPSNNLSSFAKEFQRLIPSDDKEVLSKATLPNFYLYDKRKNKTKDDGAVGVRRKRHAPHQTQDTHHHTETPEATKAYILKIFNTFSSSSSTMNIIEFENMMKQLKMDKLLMSKDSSCINELDFLEKMTNKNSETTNENKHEHGDHHHGHQEPEDRTHSQKKYFNGSVESEDRVRRDKIQIEADHMLAICPILLYQIVNRQTESDGYECLNHSNFIASDVFASNDEPIMEPKSIVWIYSTLSIIGVSLCGLLGVAVIPIMEKHYYHHVLQFLVALAVGTLAGDALLHLLPHAMMPTHKDQDMHKTMMLRGLAAVGGIVFFYFFERFLTMATEWRQKKQKRDKPSSRVRVMRDPDSISLNNGTATCKHKYSSYPYCYDEIAMETKDDHHEHQHIENGLLNNHIDKLTSQEDRLQILAQASGKKMNGTLDRAIDPDNNTLSTSIDDGSIESNALCNNNKLSENSIMKKDSVQDENYTIILREHQSKHHGHSHTHGHVHSPPSNLSAVVWMVIMGDGLHNFTDGMAIGAAFSNNIAGGLSTAVAVFCHELPHELGDFAVLLKAGMSAKQAVYYNILSSVLSFFGMCVGIWIGDTPEASQWIFAVAAGLFIYIALVDMMPELTSSHGKEEGFMLTQIMLQFLGMCCGFSTMLLIAIYEHDLKEIFASNVRLEKSGNRSRLAKNKQDQK